MAELVLKIDDGANFEDGDVLAVFNAHRIRTVHAEHLCFPHSPGGRLIGMDGNGIMPPGHVGQDWLEEVCEYRFERLSPTEGRIVRLSDLAEIRFQSNVPFVQFDGRTVAMDIALCVRRKREAQQFPVFGTYGREIWYGGREDRSDAKMLKVWQKIQQKLGKNHTDPEFKYWPAGDQDLKSHLFIPIEDVDDVESEDLIASLFDDPTANEPVMLKKRETKAKDWKQLCPHLGLTEEEVKDKTKTKDKRDKPPLKVKQITEKKPKPSQGVKT